VLGCRAELLLATAFRDLGEPERAAGHAERALDLQRRTGCRLDHARAEAIAGGLRP
jgi:hypothetical protein